MRNGFLGSILVCLAGASLALGQPAVQVVRHGPVATVPVAAPASEPAASLTSGQTVAPSDVAPPSCLDHDCLNEDVCGPPGRFWVSAEYLLWWTKSDHAPPLVTVGPPGSFGVLGAPGTTVAFGGSEIEHPVHHGGRFTVGGWLNECQTKGFEADYFFLGRNTEHFFIGSTGAPGTGVIARPFFDVFLGAPNAQILAFPDFISGSIDIAHHQSLQGAEANAICNLCCCGHCDGCGGYNGHRVDLLAGFRWQELHEDITIRENATLTNPFLAEFSGFTSAGVFDRFETRNNFYGGQIGLRGEWWRGRLFANARGTVALGGTDQHVRISGATVVNLPDGTTATLPGGLLALPTNIGDYRRDRFSVVPEVRLNIGYQVTQHLRAFVGYTFLYWTQVVRPGEQIDVAVNSTQVPTSVLSGPLTGPARPAFNFRQSDFWAQGLNLGLEFRF